MKKFLKQKVNELGNSCARWLNRKTEKLSTVKKKILLALFCLLFCGYSIYITAAALFSHTKNNSTVFIRHVQLHPHIGKNLISPAPVISEESFERVEYFKKQLDSVAKANPASFKGIMHDRPHLMDSIGLFEKLYYSQSKK
jgi:hypothetical protein